VCCTFHEVAWQQWKDVARHDPNQLLEADLAFAGVGLIIVFAGSVVAAGGIYGVGNGPASGSHPLPGTIVFFVGMRMIVFGLYLATIALTIFWSEKRWIRQRR
jgi:hypothetical protein